MCFFGILNPDGTIPEPLIAEEDIPVWKIFKLVNDKYLSHIYYAEYPLNKLVKVKKFGISYSIFNLFKIDKGLHAYKYSTAKKVYKAVQRTRCKICKCIIPKGTKYYYRKGEYVALVMKRVED